MTGMLRWGSTIRWSTHTRSGNLGQCPFTDKRLCFVTVFQSRVLQQRIATTAEASDSSKTEMNQNGLSTGEYAKISPLVNTPKTNLHRDNFMISPQQCSQNIIFPNEVYFLKHVRKIQSPGLLQLLTWTGKFPFNVWKTSGNKLSAHINPYCINTTDPKIVETLQMSTEDRCWGNCGLVWIQNEIPSFFLFLSPSFSG